MVISLSFSDFDAKVSIPMETLLTMKIDIFLNTNYELRKNVMRGVAEYRERIGLGFSFQDLTEEVRNSITMQALSQGIKCWDKDIRRYVNSRDIALYDPMEDFLEHLPRWDGNDRVTQRQQIVLKYLVSTADLKYRPPYGKAYSSHRRYASFIGTTNETMPLTDPTGSRRFICVEVDGNIDFESPVDYGQLSAQLKCEVEEQRERYFLTKEEEQALMQHNLRYQKMNGLGEMLLSLFEKPVGTPEEQPGNGRWLSVKEISARLKDTFKGAYQPDEGSLVKIGQFLSRPEYKFESERRNTGWAYWVKERQ